MFTWRTAVAFAFLQCEKVVLVSLTTSINELFASLLYGIVVKSWKVGHAEPWVFFHQAYL